MTVNSMLKHINKIGIIIDRTATAKIADIDVININFRCAECLTLISIEGHYEEKII